MNRMRAAAGLFAATSTVGLVSPDYAVLRPIKTPIHLRYFVHLFRTPAMMSIFRLESRGLGTGESGFLRLYTDRFGMLSVPIPPATEQAAIVRFLDYADQRIRRYIRAKQKLIKLLEEQKQAIIHRAVTHGLDPNFRLKQSDMEWLGDVPEHWGVISWRRLILSLKDFGSNGSFAGLRENVTYLDHPDYARLVRLTDLRKGLLDDEGIYVSEESYHYLSHSSLHGGEFLIANVGAHAGYVCEMPKINTPATLGPNMMVAKKINSQLISQKYLIVAAQSDLVQRQLRLIARESSAQPKLNKDDVRSVIMPLPPFDEQEKIVAYIHAETRTSNGIIDEIQREIELLSEYHTRLITDIITGKIDVREAAANLPNEDEEPFEDVEEDLFEDVLDEVDVEDAS